MRIFRVYCKIAGLCWSEVPFLLLGSSFVCPRLIIFCRIFVNEIEGWTCSLCVCVFLCSSNRVLLVKGHFFMDKWGLIGKCWKKLFEVQQGNSFAIASYQGSVDLLSDPHDLCGNQIRDHRTSDRFDRQSRFYGQSSSWFTIWSSVQFRIRLFFYHMYPLSSVSKWSVYGWSDNDPYWLIDLHNWSSNFGSWSGWSYLVAIP